MGRISSLVNGTQRVKENDYVSFQSEHEEEGEDINVNFENILESGDDELLALAIHFRCTSHTLNLIAAINRKTSTESPDRGICSIIFQNIVREKCSKVLVNSSNVRWNSRTSKIMEGQLLDEFLQLSILLDEFLHLSICLSSHTLTKTS
ncbi:unnamed protein product [Lepeophtheirus salmonis]|uniref:(salmon louse) hypothetical protein n=1 Tax=Lepeophtheirus salmonis TaxID=72036 RepID=A0A7R8CRZ9_LEPSM|nr:unnamed protein product [Lepeophtheirus salmonis]CAF2912160.1 unnamed protein product [Lepeophtheirus salmonis]